MATLSGMLKRLREKGYIRTETCAVDDRRKLLYPTEKGVQVQEFLDDTIRAIEGEMYSCFSPEELATLDCLQKKMLHQLQRNPHRKKHRPRSPTTIPQQRSPHFV